MLLLSKLVCAEEEHKLDGSLQLPSNLGLSQIISFLKHSLIQNSVSAFRKANKN
jgi:hypothetical protein